MEQALSRINVLASNARDRGIPVLNVRHVFKGPYVNFLVRLVSGGRGGARSGGLGTDRRLDLWLLTRNFSSTGAMPSPIPNSDSGSIITA